MGMELQISRRYTKRRETERIKEFILSNSATREWRWERVLCYLFWRDEQTVAFHENMKKRWAKNQKLQRASEKKIDNVQKKHVVWRKIWRKMHTCENVYHQIRFSFGNNIFLSKKSQAWDSSLSIRSM